MSMVTVRMGYRQTINPGGTFLDNSQQGVWGDRGEFARLPSESPGGAGYYKPLVVL